MKCKNVLLGLICMFSICGCYKKVEKTEVAPPRDVVVREAPRSDVTIRQEETTPTERRTTITHY